MVVGIPLQKGVGTLSGTVVGIILFGRDDPVPAKVFKIHGERISTAPVLLRVLVTRHSQVSWGSGLAIFRNLDLNEGILLGGKVKAKVNLTANTKSRGGEAFFY